MRRKFTTLDVSLAAWLSLNGIEPTLENRNGKVVFLFESNEKLYRSINDYNSNLLVPVNDFVTHLKTLRGKMLSEREKNGMHFGGQR
jgi:hypothetical protein